MRKMMRLIILSFASFFVPIYALSQASDAPRKQDDLYAMALDASITEMQKSWGYIDDGEHGSRIRTDYNHVVIAKKPEITEGMPAAFGIHQAEYLDSRGLVDRYKLLKKEFSVLEIGPIRTDGPYLRIQVSQSWFQAKKKRMTFAFSDWSDVEFQFDREKQAWIISNVKLGGI